MPPPFISCSPGPEPGLDATSAFVTGVRQHAPDTKVLHTHISTVVLAGPDAYKFKKPLRLDFLDFSTLEARRHFCEEELRLNRRTAPELYLEVRPLYGPPQAPQLGAPLEGSALANLTGDPNEVIDWVLHMRRFDESQTLDDLDDRGELTPALIDALARELAAFHERLPGPPAHQPPHASLAALDTAASSPSDAAPPPASLPLGHPDTALHWAKDNFATLRNRPEASARQADVEHQAEWTHTRFSALRPLMLSRWSCGRVRECHGDLHLGNWVLLQGRPVAFDAIEFNAELRWIDVVSDLAFPVMDLLARGKPRLAWRLANAWFEVTGDFEGAALLSWFMVYRALVRAKVALIQAGQEQGEAREASLTRARSHFGLALTLSRTSKPVLVSVCGLSGSGKSTVAQIAAEHLGALRLRSDVERKRLYGLRATDRPGESPAPSAQDEDKDEGRFVDRPIVSRETLYSRGATQRTYNRLHTLARELLRAGVSVVIDAASLRASERRALLDLGRDEGAPTLLLHCEAPVDVLRARVTAREHRGDDASDAGLAVLERQLTLAEPLQPDERTQTVCLDTDLSLANLDTQVTRMLDDRLTPAPAVTPPAPT